MATPDARTVHDYLITLQLALASADQNRVTAWAHLYRAQEREAPADLMALRRMVRIIAALAVDAQHAVEDACRVAQIGPDLSGEVVDIRRARA